MAKPKRRSAQQIRREAWEETVQICNGWMYPKTEEERKILRAEPLGLLQSQMAGARLCRDSIVALIESAGQESSREARSGPAGGKGNPDPVPADKSAGREVPLDAAPDSPHASVFGPDAPVPAVSAPLLQKEALMREHIAKLDVLADAKAGAHDSEFEWKRAQLADLLVSSWPDLRDLALRGLDGPSEDEESLARMIVRDSENSWPRTYEPETILELARAVLRWHEGRKKP